MAREKNWMTPLLLAAHNNHATCAGEITWLSCDYYNYNCLFVYYLEIIIANLTTVDLADRSGRSCLHHAAYNGHVQV